MFIKKNCVSIKLQQFPLYLQCCTDKILLCPYLRLTAEIKFAVPCGTSLDFKSVG